MKKNVLSTLRIIFPVAVILLVIFQAKKELAGMSLKEAVLVINNIERTNLFTLVFLGLVAIAVMSLYDYVLVRSLGLQISKRKTFKISWISNSFNNVLGFGGLSGAGLRTIFYKEYVHDVKQLIKGIAWLASSILLGLSFLSIFVLVRLLPSGNLLMEKVWLLPAIIAVALIVPGGFVALIIKKKRNHVEKGLRLSVFASYLGASVIEWLTAGAVMYFALVTMGIELDVRIVLGVFTIASVAGMISLVPGGFGSFDLLFLIGMSEMGVNQEITLTAIVLYRIAYSFIPFIIGLILAAIALTGNTLKKLEEKPIFAPAIETTNVLLTIHRALLLRLLNGSLAVIAFCCGMVTIASVSLPIDKFTLMLDLPENILTLFNALSLSFGLILLILPLELYKRTKRSYYMTLTALTFAFVFTVFKGFNLSAIFMIPLVFLLFVLLRGQFMRDRAAYTFTQMTWAMLIYFFALFNYNIIASMIWERFGRILAKDYFIYSEIHVNYVTVFAAIFVPLFLSLFILLFNKKTEQIGEEPNMEKLETFLNEEGGNALSHLGFLGDKRFFYSSDGKALIQFAKIGQRLVILGDPSGQKDSFPLILKEFLHAADQKGYLVIFYQIEQEDMGLYHDFGYRFFKLGEEAIVDLTTFTISGKKRAGLRAIHNRFNREGYTFHVEQPPFSKEFLEELRGISDEWLGRKREKSFSLGYFNEEYLQRAPIAVLKDANGKIIAFMNLMFMYQKGEISVDMMRYGEDAPSGIMDALFIHLFQWGKEQGYTTFNMGMAPLSNVGTSIQSFWTERLAAIIFNNVRYMYSFSGLRSFKEKYKPVWRGKYLAYRKNRSLPVTMILVTRLIGRRAK
ncbi:bifunctional lysylphosphatidylglycerol flippase/synthetase MprF [Bacillus sp. WMMC1349]|uniref:bifunctional lysylphosphatidylglycerol flippase/synthetase MprF n=1 Tax=Bacillus sp. WMMC1349 TaxID=2736254 RepID=UPI001554AD49|nr:bifunctional lysylphosphatidylglycerol flippase/synthetase MprF [Bacillus sp. WMMC1349]NPC91891.1 bifunctional lysylphosphatidylglycerol flippase/synthetase MprF [Bacillus sp. WMMC1349]